MIYKILYLIFGICIFLSTFEKKFINTNIRSLNLFLIFILIFFSGLRHEVGGDWDTYYTQCQNFSKFSLLSFKIYIFSDPIYAILCKLSHEINLNVYGVNFVISFLFCISIYKAADHFKSSKYFSIIFFSSFLFFFIFLMMGYSRQCLSLSFAILSLLFFDKNKKKLCLIFISLSFLSHISIILFYFFLFISYVLVNSKKILINKKIFVYYILSSIAIIFLIIIFVQSNVLIRLMNEYFFINDYHLSLDVHQKNAAEGVFFKIIYVIIFKILFLFNVKINKVSLHERIYILANFLIIFSIIPFMGYFSMFIERVAVFTYLFIPYSVYKILENFSSAKTKKLFILFVFCLSLIFTESWFKFANHKIYWINYKNVLYLK